MHRIIKTALLPVSIAFFLSMTGCDHSDSSQGSTTEKQSEADDISLLCPSVEGAGLAAQCTTNSRLGIVDIIIESNDDEVARKTCSDIANKMTPLTKHLAASWKLQVFSPLRRDKPIAVCPLHQS